MKKYNTIKIWAETLPKLRILSALNGVPIVKIIDTFASDALKKCKKDKK